MFNSIGIQTMPSNPSFHVDRVEVRWIGGVNQVFDGLEIDTLHILRQGSAAAR